MAFNYNLNMVKNKMIINLKSNLKIFLSLLTENDITL